MFRVTTLVVLAVVLGAGSAAFADSYYDGAQEALKTNQQVITDITNLQVEQKTQDALGAMIYVAVATLKEKGYTQEAHAIQQEWNQQFSMALGQMQMFDLGDHRPLSQWLGKTYKTLADKLGEPILKLLHLDDLYVVNYALPVVVHPGGDRKNGDRWNRGEYARHFIPFMAVIAYWTSYIGCRAATGTHPAFRRWCGAIAMVLRNGTKSMLAPKLADFVFKKMGGEALDNVPLVTQAMVNQYEQEFISIPRD